ncbi:MAG: glutathione synthase, partial [Pseudomonadota bacterium]
MALRIGVQMDDINGIDIRGDTTFALMLEAQARGHALFTYLPEALVYDAGRLTARGRATTVHDDLSHHVDLGDEEQRDVARDLDVVLLRQDPPFDMAYITTTHLLERVHPRTLVVNDPG